MFAQTFPQFQDKGAFAVTSTYNPTIYMILGILSLIVNITLVAYMILKIKKTGRNPYKGELYTDHREYREIRSNGLKTVLTGA